MANVNIKFNGKDFLLSCDDGQEEHLEELANHLGNKFDKLKADLGNIGENKLLLINNSNKEAATKNLNLSHEQVNLLRKLIDS